MSGDWKFLSITRPATGRRVEAPKGPCLNIASPAGSVRLIPLSPQDLARIAEQASRGLGLYVGQYRVSEEETTGARKHRA